jgi:hypothetical protein
MMLCSKSTKRACMASWRFHVTHERESLAVPDKKHTKKTQTQFLQIFHDESENNLNMGAGH